MTKWLLVCACIAAVHQAPTPRESSRDQQNSRVTSQKKANRLSLAIRPTMASAPGAIRATALVERHPANSALTLAAVCPDYLRRSTVALDGADDAKKHTMVFESLPPCTYDITATLHRRDGDDIVELLVAKVVR